MESSSPLSEGQRPVDPSEPFKGLILCCTSISAEHRTQIDQQIVDLGGIHKLDLTPDVTHLIVGEYDTPKYRHVARHREDIKAMDAAWVHAVSDLWKRDEELDFHELEKKYQLKPFERRGAQNVTSLQAPLERDSLRVCLSGFAEQNGEIENIIVANGGRYMDHLSRESTHLVVHKPRGKKFDAAQAWGIRIVTLDWVKESIKRGMILDEEKFHPLLPPEEQGVGAWIRRDPRRQSLLKRQRSTLNNGAEEGVRKLRKTASMKLINQHESLWGDILGGATAKVSPEVQETVPETRLEAQSRPTEKAKPPPVPENQGIFSACLFYIHGFDEQRSSVLSQAIASLGGHVASSLQDVAERSPPGSGSSWNRLLIVPQTSQPETHPQAPGDDIHIVTEFYVEKCLHNRQFFSPANHALGRPFPRFPIDGFKDLTICTAAFTGIDLNHVVRSIEQLGGRFQEQFRKTTSVVVCNSLVAMRKEKLRLALSWGVPIVSADWLWECISTGYKVPFDDYIYPEIKDRNPTQPAIETKPDSRTLQRTRSAPAPATTTQPRRAKPTINMSGFENDSDESPQKPAPRKQIPRAETTTSADFFTAPTAIASGTFDPPLTELSSASLNNKPQLPLRASDHFSRTSSDPSHEKPTAAAPPTLTKAASTTTSTKTLENSRDSAAVAARIAKAAERQALTSKITTLLDTPDAHLTTTSGERDTVPRRKRQFLGRALSNASTATHGDHASPPSAAAEGFSDEDENNNNKEEPKPPSTQIAYADPEAQIHKAQLMSRVRGGDMSDVKSIEPPPQSSKIAAGGIVAQGRTLRRRD